MLRTTIQYEQDAPVDPKIIEALEKFQIITALRHPNFAQMHNIRHLYIEVAYSSILTSPESMVDKAQGWRFLLQPNATSKVSITRDADWQSKFKNLQTIQLSIVLDQNIFAPSIEPKYTMSPKFCIMPQQLEGAYITLKAKEVSVGVSFKYDGEAPASVGLASVKEKLTAMMAPKKSESAGS